MTSGQEEQPWHLSEGPCYVGLTHDHLNAQEVMDRVRSPAAGAIVLFAGKSYHAPILELSVCIETDQASQEPQETTLLASQSRSSNTRHTTP